VTVAPSFGFGYPGEKSPGVGEKTRAGGGLFLVEIEEDSSNWGSACLAGLNKCNTFGPQTTRREQHHDYKIYFSSHGSRKSFSRCGFCGTVFQASGRSKCKLAWFRVIEIDGGGGEGENLREKSARWK